MLSAYVEVLLCVIELLAFVAFKNTTQLLRKPLSRFLKNHKAVKFDHPGEGGSENSCSH